MNPLKKWFQTILTNKKDDPQKKKVCWFFLGKILGKLLFLTDEQVTEFMELDDHDPKVLREIIREFVVPHYRYFPPENQEKIRNSLTYYLVAEREKLEWIFSSSQVPLDDEIAKLFYTLVWQELYGTDKPDQINPDDYEEDCGIPFVNSLYYSGLLVEKYNPTGKEPSLDNVIARLKQNP